jgi:hypothetical protein
MSDKSKQAARDRIAEILLYHNIQNTGPYSGQVGPEDPRAGDNVFYNGPGFHDGHGARGGPMPLPPPAPPHAPGMAPPGVAPTDGYPPDFRRGEYYGGQMDGGDIPDDTGLPDDELEGVPVS